MTLLLPAAPATTPLVPDGQATIDRWPCCQPGQAHHRVGSTLARDHQPVFALRWRTHPATAGPFGPHTGLIPVACLLQACWSPQREGRLKDAHYDGPEPGKVSEVQQHADTPLLSSLEWCRLRVPNVPVCARTGHPARLCNFARAAAAAARCCLPCDRGELAPLWAPQFAHSKGTVCWQGPPPFRRRAPRSAHNKSACAGTAPAQWSGSGIHSSLSAANGRARRSSPTLEL